jgi:cytochrome o ubiquinol oxidase subunit 2
MRPPKLQSANRLSHRPMFTCKRHGTHLPPNTGSTQYRRAFVSFASAFLLTSCQRAGVLDPQGPISSAEKTILLNATGIMLVVVVPVIALTLASAWWYRASNKRAVFRPDLVYSGSIELVVWSIPAMVVILLAGVAWLGAHELDPALKLKSDVAPVRVEAVSLDWKWLFIYPDLRVATVNELVVPVGTPIEFTLTSASVMNAFFIPQLGSQIYTMPGMSTHLNLLAGHGGDYPGISSHFSGDGFSDMRFTVHAVPTSDFDTWLARVRSGTSTLSASAYTELARPSKNLAPQSYAGVDPMLYEYILRQAAPMAASSLEAK